MAKLIRSNSAWASIYMKPRCLRILVVFRVYIITMCGQVGVTGWDGWGLQCLFLEGLGMGGTLCTHVTIFTQRGKGVHNTEGQKSGMGREGWTNITLFGFCRSFGQGRLTRQFDYCGDMGSETCTQYNLWVKGGRVGTWHPHCTPFSSDESVDNNSYQWIWVRLGGHGLDWLWFLGRWGIWGGTKCTRQNVRIWRGVRFQTIARMDFYIWKGMDYFDIRAYVHNFICFHRSIEHFRDNRRHILARTIHVEFPKREVQRETWMLDKLSTVVKYDMVESPSTTKIKFLMSMMGDHTRRTGKNKDAYRSWIGKVYKNRDSTGRKRKNEGNGIRNHRCSDQLRNSRGHTLRCSHYLPSPFPDHTCLPCVVYCHGNSGSRADANKDALILLPSNITVFTLDFSASGLSDGNYVSLGWHERDDLKVVVSYLRKNEQISRIGLWGRSMGAVTSLLYGAEDPSIAGMVLDSAFSNLFNLMMELVDVYKIRLPKFTVMLF
ncbi:hypothetical protein L1987_84567 [Smallanthus sonchifolius]|uniref:Uncharacterized protein n=1 Tax=Smallanthus sonchifolius TaxID=185202 RepID=A0ACB8YFN8_9ASTR|nr:hypothetical protein L1987_84567 [Smallanthus sonchifolius]